MATVRFHLNLIDLTQRKNGDERDRHIAEPRHRQYPEEAGPDEGKENPGLPAVQDGAFRRGLQRSDEEEKTEGKNKQTHHERIQARSRLGDGTQTVRGRENHDTDAHEPGDEITDPLGPIDLLHRA